TLQCKLNRWRGVVRRYGMRASPTAEPTGQFVGLALLRHATWFLPLPRQYQPMKPSSMTLIPTLMLCAISTCVAQLETERTSEPSSGQANGWRGTFIITQAGALTDCRKLVAQSSS